MHQPVLHDLKVFTGHSTHNNGNAFALTYGICAIAVMAIVGQAIGWFPLRSGFAGVDVAIVTAGFLIGGHVDRAIRRKEFSLTAFYVSSSRRIMMPTIAVVLATCIACFFLMSARELRLTGASGAAALLGMSNIFYWGASKYASAILHTSPLLMTWAVSLLLQFCFLFPLLIMAMRRWSRLKILLTIGFLALLSFLACAIVTPYRPTTAFYLPHLRAWEFLAGALVAMIALDRPRPISSAFAQSSGWIGLAMILLSFHVFPDGARYPGAAALLPTSGAVCLLLDQRGFVRQRLLGSTPLRLLGMVSFSVYLWHAPILKIVDLAAFGKPAPTSLAAAALFSLPLAWLAWLKVERPWMVGVPPPTRPRSDMLALAGFAGIIMICSLVPASFYMLRGVPERLSASATAVERTIEGGRSNPCIIRYGVIEPSADPRCFQDGARKEKVALIGDSHAAALGPGFKKLAKREEIGLVQIEKSACLPLLESIVPQQFETLHDRQCESFNNSTFDHIVKDPAIKTVVMTGFWSGSFLNGDADAKDAGVFRRDPALADEGELKRALTETIRRYREKGKEVVILGDIPLFRFDPGQDAVSGAITLRGELRDLIGKPDGADDGVVSKQWVRPDMEAEKVVAQSAADVPGTVYVPLRSLMCGANTCRYADRRGSFYIDFHHLSPQGADYVAEHIGL